MKPRRIRPLTSVGGRLALAAVLTVCFAGSANALQGTVSPKIAAEVAAAQAHRPPDTVVPFAPAAVQAVRRLRVPKPVVKYGMSLRLAPVAVPLVLEIPVLGVHAPMVGVGLTPKNAMDAPEGPLGSPVWQQAFWYRGSSVPGAISTALIAGHIDGPSGSTAVFGDISRLRPGDRIIVHDNRTGLDVRFAVTSSVSYTLAQASQPAVLQHMYGDGPVNGTRPTRAPDGRAHLTLVTCAGVFRRGIGTHDHRLAVYAIRVG